MRKRLTKIFPCLIPIRYKQRYFCFYLKMKLDKNKYASTIQEELLPFKVYETSWDVINNNSGYDLVYQKNKLHNVSQAIKCFDHVVISPNETFSFFQLFRKKSKHLSFRKALVLQDHKIVPVLGGGLCFLSNYLFYLFLHIPFDIIERHHHSVESIAPTDKMIPQGLDATIHQGWLDLKAINNTNITFQITFHLEEDKLVGTIYADQELDFDYSLMEENLKYVEKDNKVYLENDIYRIKTDKLTNTSFDLEKLYHNVTQITYFVDPDLIQRSDKNE